MLLDLCGAITHTGPLDAEATVAAALYQGDDGYSEEESHHASNLGNKLEEWLWPVCDDSVVHTGHVELEHNGIHPSTSGDLVSEALLDGVRQVRQDGRDRIPNNPMCVVLLTC